MVVLVAMVGYLVGAEVGAEDGAEDGAQDGAEDGVTVDALTGTETFMAQDSADSTVDSRIRDEFDAMVSYDDIQFISFD
jgi:hypothetical protein